LPLGGKDSGRRAARALQPGAVVKERAGNFVSALGANPQLFKINGYIKDRIVSLNGSNLNEKQLGQNVFLLEVVSGGSAMRGQKSWFSVTKNAILCSEIEIERNK
jgi:hypothetical protein